MNTTVKVFLAVFLMIPSFVLASEVVLKSGQKVEGKIIGNTNDHIKVDSQGVALTYYLDEIDSIDGNPVAIQESAKVTKVKAPDVVQPEVIVPAELQKVAPPENTNIPKEFSQKDGLFKISLPDGWRGQDIPEGVIILPPPPKGNGIVIKFKADSGAESRKAIKIVEYNIKQKMMGNIIENQEMRIDNIPAQYLLYTISLNGENMYSISVRFINKGYIFSVDYGDSDRSEVNKVINLLNTWKF